MLWRYLSLVISFSFRRTTPAIDALQVVAASALPSVAKFAGVPMPASATNDVLAYIGLAAVAFVALRLVSAPYFVWREQIGEAARLREELAMPVRAEMQRMAESRADAKVELATLISGMLFIALRRNPKRDEKVVAGMVTRGIALSGRANTGGAFASAFRWLSGACFDFQSSMPSDQDEARSQVIQKLVLDMEDYLHGSLTGEALALRLPPDIGSGTPL